MHEPVHISVMWEEVSLYVQHIITQSFITYIHLHVHAPALMLNLPILFSWREWKPFKMAFTYLFCSRGAYFSICSWLLSHSAPTSSSSAPVCWQNSLSTLKGKHAWLALATQSKYYFLLITNPSFFYSHLWTQRTWKEMLRTKFRDLRWPARAKTAGIVVSLPPNKAGSGISTSVVRSASDTAEYHHHIDFIKCSYRSKKWLQSCNMFGRLQQRAQLCRNWIANECPSVTDVLDSFPCLANPRIRLHWSSSHGKCKLNTEISKFLTYHLFSGPLRAQSPEKN